MPQPVVTLHQDVVAELTGPGGDFELEQVTVGGLEFRAFKRAPANLGDFFAEAGSAFGERVLLVQEGREHTIGELLGAARRLAASLRDEFAVAAGDRVGIVMRNRPEYLVSLFAVARAGAVAVLFNSRGSAAELRAATDDVPCSVVIADEPRAGRLAEGGCAVPVVVVRESGGPGGPLDYAALAGTDRREAEPVPVDRDAPAWILFTSGTSGRAKGAVLTQRNVGNMIANMRFLKESGIELNSRLHGVPADVLRKHLPPPVSLLVYPLFHVSGLSVLMTALLNGGRTVGLRRWDPVEAGRLMIAHRVTLLSAPPLALHDLLSLPDAAEVLGGLVQIGAGGQATPPGLARRMSESAPDAAQGGGWGMTETVATVCSIAGPLVQARPGAAGRVIPIMDVRAVNEEGLVLSSGGTGELEVRGVLVMSGYWGLPEATKAAFDGEWYRTGDLGHVDAEGFVHVIDRITDMVISGGENIYCAEVEKVLSLVDDFVEVAVFGVPDLRLGERTIAAIRPRAGAPTSQEEVKALVGEALADYKVPSEVVFLAEPFPRTATGKVLKAELRAAFLTGAT